MCDDVDFVWCRVVVLVYWFWMMIDVWCVLVDECGWVGVLGVGCVLVWFIDNLWWMKCGWLFCYWVLCWYVYSGCLVEFWVCCFGLFLYRIGWGCWLCCYWGCMRWFLCCLIFVCWVFLWLIWVWVIMYCCGLCCCLCWLMLCRFLWWSFFCYYCNLVWFWRVLFLMLSLWWVRFDWLKYCWVVCWVFFFGFCRLVCVGWLWCCCL